MTGLGPHLESAMATPSTLRSSRAGTPRPLWSGGGGRAFPGRLSTARTLCFTRIGLGDGQMKARRGRQGRGGGACLARGCSDSSRTRWLGGTIMGG